MADDIAIKVEHVSKTFKLPHEKQTSIKGVLISKLRGSNRSFEKQEVLKDVSFEVKKGEFFGIVGRNGSGKSTLLKILAGIYKPSQGHIQINGKLTPFIELGVGFNPELTGRENVYLNGALLGFSRKEMNLLYDDIVNFAELERFMDQKLKNYSSGMQVRLAFSIAIQAKSGILVLDEVLAVGDEAFQQKCIDIFENYKALKQTIVLVTHDMAIVRRFCSRAMLISEGEISRIGSPEQVAREYSNLNDESISESIISRNEATKDNNVKIKITNNNVETTKFVSSDLLTVKVSWSDDLEGVQNVGIGIVKQSGEFIFGANTFNDTFDLSRRELKYEMKLDLGPGTYFVMVGLFGNKEKDVKKFIDRGPQFTVQAREDDSSQGLVRLKHTWVS